MVYSNYSSASFCFSEILQTERFEDNRIVKAVSLTANDHISVVLQQPSD